MFQFTVFFEGPFWVGVFEKYEGGFIHSRKITFGAEPSDELVYQFVNCDLKDIQFNVSVPLEDVCDKKISFKRKQRLARKATQETGIGTKSQQALKLEHEFRKTEVKRNHKRIKEEINEYKFLKKSEKRKKKRRGH